MISMDSITAVKCFDELPPELTSLIFSFLPCKDRKKCRLVSKKWNQLCNCPSIFKREKFWFHNYYLDILWDIWAIDDFLKHCKLQVIRPTIELYRLDREQFPSRGTWQRIGEKIHSVVLVECKLSPIIMRDIFLHCPNLHTFKSSSVETLESFSKRNDWLLQVTALTILFKSLEHCPKLVNLCTRTRVDLNISEFYHALRMISSSKLECFMLSFTLKFVADDCCRMPAGDLTNRLTTLTDNETLRTLILGFGERMSESIPADYCLPILKHFCNLRHLELAVDSDEVLQTIFQYHIHLQTLILYGMSTCTTFGFTGWKMYSSHSEKVGYSISRLSELIHLGLVGYQPGDWIDGTLLEFDFPRLEYFRLGIVKSQMEEVSIDCLSTAVPSLRVLLLETVRVYIDELVDLCKHLPGLKTLYYDAQWLDDPIPFFDAQPSLIYMLNLPDVAYTYDRSTEELDRFRIESIFKVYYAYLSRAPCRWPAE